MKKSAGILLYRITANNIEVLLAHPGGPFWKNKDSGAWSIPKGEIEDDEDELTAAIREFKEETGISIEEPFRKLHAVKLKSGKWVSCFTKEEDPEISGFLSNYFELEWPPRSGKKIMVPEIDKLEWFTIAEAREKINPAMIALLDELTETG